LIFVSVPVPLKGRCTKWYRDFLIVNSKISSTYHKCSRVCDNQASVSYSSTGQLYGCQDGHSVITSDGWIISCPPADEVVSRSPLIYNELPTVADTREFGKVFMQCCHVNYTQQIGFVE